MPPVQSSLFPGPPVPSVHLAILREPWLTMILDGRKTIESRFSKVKSPPYGSIRPGDTVYLKKSGGLITGMANVTRVEFHDSLTPEKVSSLIDKHADALRITPEFAAAKRESKYATLAWLSGVRRIDPGIEFKKRDQLAWLVFPPGSSVPFPVPGSG